MKKERIKQRDITSKNGFLKQVQKLDRRIFIRLSAVFGIGASLPFASCLRDKRPEISALRNPDLLSEKEWKALLAVQDHLFPHEKNAPGAHDVNAAGFFQWVLADPLLDPNEIAFKKNGLTWIDEESSEMFEQSFFELSNKNKEETLRSLVEKSWGRSWVSVMLLHIFEALLSDPIYGGNTDKLGWDWLNYSAGIPEAVEGKTYLDYTLSDGTVVSKK